MKENEVGLKKIMDMTRLIAIVLLLLHYYYYHYSCFKGWRLTHQIAARVLGNITRTGLFESFDKSKWLALLFLFLSVLGAKGRKDKKYGLRQPMILLVGGIGLYFGADLIYRCSLQPEVLSIMYMLFCSAGFLIILTAGTIFSRILHIKLSIDPFNNLNETFPQEERLLENEYSINLPASYSLKERKRNSWINIINPFRGTLIIGSPGSGKTWFIVERVIDQHIRKEFAMVIYDFKYPSLSTYAYNQFLHNKRRTPVKSFYTISFSDLSRSSRCNPLASESLIDISDAAEAARTILLGLNKTWIKRKGEFFVESPIRFVTAVIWFLKKYQDGKYCTLPHVIELVLVEYEKLFNILKTEPEIEALISPFVTAYVNDATEQLEGQIGSAKISLADLSTSALYWVLSHSDFDLDVNDPNDPKIICIANDPQRSSIYGAVASLIISRLAMKANKPDKAKSSFIFDEFPTLYFKDIDRLIATARSNRLSTTVVVQDISQLENEYSRDQAKTIFNTMGNVISGQVGGETTKIISEKIGRVMQERESISINSYDTSISHSSQLDLAVPPSRISSLSSGDFVGVVADDPDLKIQLKAFFASIKHPKIGRNAFKLPVHQNVTEAMINENFRRVKAEVLMLVEDTLSGII